MVGASAKNLDHRAGRHHHLPVFNLRRGRQLKHLVIDDRLRPVYNKPHDATALGQNQHPLHREPLVGDSLGIGEFSGADVASIAFLGKSGGCQEKPCDQKHGGQQALETRMQIPVHHRLPLNSRSISRFKSFLAIVSRLSYCALPLASAISTLALPSLK